MGKSPPGLFITGTDTHVGKTYVAALIARALVTAGHRVGVYKPAASGCSRHHGQLVADDAVALWEAAGRPQTLAQVCPQCFAAPLAPHLAAQAEGRSLDASLLRTGLDAWRDADVVVVEGAGGLFSPLGAHELVADLAADLGYPLVVVSDNSLGVVHRTLATLRAAEAYGRPLALAGVVLNRVHVDEQDASVPTNRQELAAHTRVPVLGEVACGGDFDRAIDWRQLAHEIR